MCVCLYLCLNVCARLCAYVYCANFSLTLVLFFFFFSSSHSRRDRALTSRRRCICRLTFARRPVARWCAARTSARCCSLAPQVRVFIKWVFPVVFVCFLGEQLACLSSGWNESCAVFFKTFLFDFIVAFFLSPVLYLLLVLALLFSVTTNIPQLTMIICDYFYIRLDWENKTPNTIFFLLLLRLYVCLCII